MPTLKAYSSFTMPSGNTGGSLIVDIAELYSDEIRFTSDEIILPMRDIFNRDITLLIGGSGFLGDDVNAVNVNYLQANLSGLLYVTVSGFSLGYDWFENFLTAENQDSVRSKFYSGADTFWGSNGDDVLRGYAGNDSVSGGGGNDKLDGESGNDLLRGEAGRDSMRGGSGNDIFDFNALFDLGVLSNTRDVITDFVRGQDKIDLASLDANQPVAGNQAFFAPVVGGAFSGSFYRVGALYFDNVAHVLYGNSDADKTAEFAIELTGVTTLAASNFLL